MENYTVGSIVKGEVTGIEPYGIFVKVDECNGLIHISEIANNYISNITKYVNIGERIYAKVIEVDTENNRLKLSIKGLNYKEFYEREIQFRRASVFPPFCDIITVTFSGEVERDVQNAVKEFGKGLDEAAKTRYSDVKFILYGPFRNEIYKISGRYRMRFIIKCKNNPALRKMLSELLIQYMSGIKNVSISADVNPVNL